MARQPCFVARALLRLYPHLVSTKQITKQFRVADNQISNGMTWRASIGLLGCVAGSNRPKSNRNWHHFDRIFQFHRVTYEITVSGIVSAPAAFVGNNSPFAANANILSQ